MRQVSHNRGSILAYLSPIWLLYDRYDCTTHELAELSNLWINFIEHDEIKAIINQTSNIFSTEISFPTVTDFKGDSLHFQKFWLF